MEDFRNVYAKYVPTEYKRVGRNKMENYKEKYLPERVVFNKDKGTTTILHRESSYAVITNGMVMKSFGKFNAFTIKKSKDDEFDNVMGFLIAYFENHSGLSRKSAQQYLEGVRDAKEIFKWENK